MTRNFFKVCTLACLSSLCILHVNPALSCEVFSSRELLSHSTIINFLQSLKADRLISELEFEHQITMRAHDTSAKGWLKFYPFWVFDSASTLEKILEYFDPVDGSAPRYAFGMARWVLDWEALYAKNFGQLSKRWTENNFAARRRFIQRLLVEGAVRYVLREGGGEVPAFFGPQDTQDHPYLNELRAQAKIYFHGDMSKFQKAFDVAYRQTVGSQVSGRIPVPVAETQLRSDLRSVGVDVKKVRQWKPKVAADFRGRRSDLDVHLAVESIKAFGDSKAPLVGLFLQLTGAESENEQLAFHWAEAAEILQRNGGVEIFFQKVNEQLLREGFESLHPRLGTKSMAEELAVQLAAFYISASGEEFKGLQANDPSAPFYVNMNDEILLRSGLRLFELEALVLRRLKA